MNRPSGMTGTLSKSTPLTIGGNQAQVGGIGIRESSCLGEYIYLSVAQKTHFLLAQPSHTFTPTFLQLYQEEIPGLRGLVI